MDVVYLVAFPVTLTANMAFTEFERKQDALFVAQLRDPKKKFTRVEEYYDKLRCYRVDVVIAVARAVLFLKIAQVCFRRHYLKHSVFSMFFPFFFIPFVINQLLQKLSFWMALEIYQNHARFKGLGNRLLYSCSGQEESCALCRYLFVTRVENRISNESYLLRDLDCWVWQHVGNYYFTFNFMYIYSICAALLIK